MSWTSAPAKGKVSYVYSPETVGKAVLSSPDGRYQIYCIGTLDGGDFSSDELVSLDTQSGRYERIGVVNGGIRFVTSRYQLVQDYWTSLEVYDLVTRQYVTPVPELAVEYDQLKDGHQICLQASYDAENDLVLVLTTAYYNQTKEDFTNDKWGNCFLRVYSSDWKLIRTIDTGVKAYGGGANDFPHGGMEMKGKGTVLVGGQKVVNYLGK